jgi:hypothetical protein
VKLIEGHKPPPGDLACTWCGRRFTFRWIASAKAAGKGAGDSLEGHWKTSRRCSRNRSVSDQTQAKYQPFGSERIVPGENQLRLVEERAAAYERE